ncbi:outer membrane protein assembly factor BamE [Novosphingobium bradum]|uniref:Outer membrane protein assembly factor BamE n=1 Tax=Novosphingobium bradum TaxID=1737444 RepID=A0ABV7IM46_9SPHN
MRVYKRLVVGAALLGAGLVTLSGCASIKDHRGYLVDQALVDSVQPGIDNRQSVERALGRPTYVAQFGEPVWYYVAIDTRQAAFTRPRPYQETVLKVHFDAAGNVSRIEKTGLEKVVRLDPDHHKTPTLGRNRGFLEDLFGNIGTVGAPGMGGGAGGEGGGGPNGS